MSRRCNCPGCMLGPSATMRLIIIGPAGHTANRTSSCCDQRTRTVDLALEWHPSTRTIHQLQDLSQLGRAGLSIFASLHDLLFQLFHLRRQQEAFTLEPSNNCLPLLQLLAEAVCILLRTHVLRVGGLSTALHPSISGCLTSTTCRRTSGDFGTLPLGAAPSLSNSKTGFMRISQSLEVN